MSIATASGNTCKGLIMDDNDIGYLVVFLWFFLYIVFRVY